MGLVGSCLFGGGLRTLRPVSIERLAPVECRLEGRTLRGVAMRYGEQARDRAEMFLSGAFAPIGPVAMNLQHDRSGLREVASTDGGSLRIDDRPDVLRVEADLREGSAELSLVRRRALRGLSVECRTRAETRNPAGVRVIERAELVGIGLVDSGSYTTSIELRQDAWLTATVPTRQRLQCTCQGGGCDSVEFAPEAFDQVFEMEREVLAVGGEGFASVLGSRRRGTLLLEAGRQGLRVALAGPRHTAAARQVAENARAGPVYARPIIDLDDSTFADEGPGPGVLSGGTPGNPGQGDTQRRRAYPRSGGRRRPGARTSKAAPVAVTLTAAELAAETGADLSRATRVLGVATAMVEDYAPLAPPAVQKEAAIRFGGWLLASDYGAIRAETLGPMSADYVTNHSAAFRNCGAAMLLTRWKVRRGGIIG